MRLSPRARSNRVIPLFLAWAACSDQLSVLPASASLTIRVADPEVFDDEIIKGEVCAKDKDGLGVSLDAIIDVTADGAAPVEDFREAWSGRCYSYQFQPSPGVTKVTLHATSGAVEALAVDVAVRPLPRAVDVSVSRSFVQPLPGEATATATVWSQEGAPVEGFQVIFEVVPTDPAANPADVFSTTDDLRATTDEQGEARLVLEVKAPLEVAARVILRCDDANPGVCDEIKGSSSIGGAP